MTSGLIRLSYKGKGETGDPGAYRPITLLPVHYKIFSKAGANRWKPILAKLISPAQKGFTPGRRGSDHVRTIQDAWWLYQKEDGTGAWLVLDFSKAYDRVEWPWLRSLMKHVGAGPNMLTCMDAFYPYVNENALHRQLILPNGWSRPIRC